MIEGWHCRTAISSPSPSWNRLAIFLCPLMSGCEETVDGDCSYASRLDTPLPPAIIIMFFHSIFIRDLKLNLPGGRWRQSLGEAGPHQGFRKKCSDRNITMLLNILIFILKRGPKVAGRSWLAGCEFETPDKDGRRPSRQSRKNAESSALQRSEFSENIINQIVMKLLVVGN